MLKILFNTNCFMYQNSEVLCWYWEKVLVWSTELNLFLSNTRSATCYLSWLKSIRTKSLKLQLFWHF